MCLPFHQGSCLCAWYNIYLLKFVAVAVQSLSRVWVFAIPWTAALQASLSFTVSPSLLRLMSIESAMVLNVRVKRVIIHLKVAGEKHNSPKTVEGQPEEPLWPRGEKSVPCAGPAWAGSLGWERVEQSTDQVGARVRGRRAEGVPPWDSSLRASETCSRA